MRTSILAIAASALLMGAEAGSVLKRHAHAHAHLDKRGLYETAPAETCSVVTYTTWVPYFPTYETTQTVQSTVYVAPTTSACSYTTVTPTYGYPVPTPEVTTCATPGTYTFPAKTVTVTSTAVVCAPTTTVLTSGTHTYGYTSHVITSETTVTVTYATVSTTSSTIYTTATSTILSCKTPGTYTVDGYTTTVTETVTATYPTLTSYAPGTYTHPASIVTATESKVVYTCPYEKYVAPKPTTTPCTTTASTTPSVYATPTTTPAGYGSPKPHGASSSTIKAKPTGYGSTTSSSYAGGLPGAGKQWCITYTQYNADNSCKAPSQISADIADIASKGFKAVRIYAPDCGALEAVSAACSANSLKLVLGIFVRSGDKETGWTDFYSQVTTITTWKQWGVIDLIVVGNESVFGGICSAADLAGLIQGAREKLKAAGYTGPITTSEVVGTLQANPSLCPYLDVVAVNIQPYFNGGYAQDSGAFVKSQMGLAEAVCGKKTYCLEAGWPKAGSPMGNAVPGTEEQVQAISSIYEIDEGFISYYTTYDDLWKSSASNNGVEPHFGCAQVFPL